VLHLPCLCRERTRSCRVACIVGCVLCSRASSHLPVDGSAVAGTVALQQTWALPFAVWPLAGELRSQMRTELLTALRLATAEATREHDGLRRRPARRRNRLAFGPGSASLENTKGRSCCNARRQRGAQPAEGMVPEQHQPASRGTVIMAMLRLLHAQRMMQHCLMRAI
jgi:hypothetical protein